MGATMQAGSGTGPGASVRGYQEGSRSRTLAAPRRWVAAAGEGVAAVLWRRTDQRMEWAQGWPGWLQRAAYLVVMGYAAALGLFAAETGLRVRPDDRLSWAVASVLVGLHVVGLAVAAWRPVLGWRIVVGGVLASVVVPPPFLAPGIAGALWFLPSVNVVLGLVGLCRPGRVAVAAGAVTALVLGTAGQLTALSVNLGWSLGLLLVGAGIGSRRIARRDLVVEQGRAAAAQAAGAVLAERARIAREMHDVVAHHMSLIAVRCESAPFRLPELPAPARTELVEVGAAAREALTEMQALLGVLRSGGQPPEHAPQPGIAELDDLVAEAAAAGSAVRSSVDVAPAEVSAAVGLTVYRVVQQALTNAAQHAGGAPVSVAVALAGDSLRIDVVNGPGTGSVPGGGHGVVGMRERVELHAGRLRAGPTPDGGFAVHAELPVPHRDPAP